MTPDFQAVWNRVTGAETEVSEQSLLCELIGRKSADIALYHQLRCRMGCTLFSRLEQEEQEQRRALQTHYYLLTGDSALCPQEPPVIRQGLLPALRTAYARELENSRLLSRYSEKFTTEALRQLCQTQAEQEVAHAELLWQAAKRCL